SALNCTHAADRLKQFEENRPRQTTSQKPVPEGSPSMTWPRSKDRHALPLVAEQALTLPRHVPGRSREKSVLRLGRSREAVTGLVLRGLKNLRKLLTDKRGQ